MPDVPTIPPQRQVTPRPTIKGSIQYPCCGRTYEMTGEHITQVTCPLCFTSYDILLTPRQPAPEKYLRGTTLRLKQDVHARVGADERVLKAGSVFTAGSDPYGLLGTNEETTLLEVPSPVASHPESHLLAPVANEFLEEVPPRILTEDPTTGENGIIPDG